jgi:phosphoglycolate phosphatase
MLTNIFFDLDGTLTDSKEGIVKCFHYSMNKLGRSLTDVPEVNDFIGPSLRVTFRKLLGSDDERLIEKAVAIYRERFSTVGLFENKVYPGIPEVLSALHKNSLKLYVATSKMKLYADRILEHFQLAPWFSGVFGSELEGRFDDKAELIEFIMSGLKLAAGETIMVGDRREDITAGKANRIRTIGVTYGYGSQMEIIDAAPDFTCGSPSEIQSTIMSLR